ncbi:MAG: hypothetical protein ACTSRJ_07070 [Candidatus Hodarchaeales archaeon]
MKVPVGSKVTVDLWDPTNKRGMVKHFDDTLTLLRAESDFPLIKGQNAIVVKSFENFVRIVPDDEYSRAIQHTEKKVKLDKDELIPFIYSHLKDNLDPKGGIVSILELYHFFKQTSLNAFITLDKLYKISKIPSLPFQCIEEGGNLHFILPDSERTHDCSILIEIAKEDPALSISKIRNKLHWSDLRIRKTLNYMVEKNYCKRESSYKDGDIYYFRSD